MDSIKTIPEKKSVSGKTNKKRVDYKQKLKTKSLNFYRKVFEKRVMEKEGMTSGWITRPALSLLKTLVIFVIVNGIMLFITLYTLNYIFNLRLILYDYIYITLGLGVVWWFIKMELRDLYSAFRGKYDKFKPKPLSFRRTSE